MIDWKILRALQQELVPVTYADKVPEGENLDPHLEAMAEMIAQDRLTEEWLDAR